MISVDVELALVGLVAMLEPATLISSLLALIVGDRPLRTGLLFYLGGIGVTLTIGVAAAFVLGNVAAAPRSGPKTWVTVFDFIAGVAILLYAAWTIARTPDPAQTEANVERMRKVADALLANAGPFMLIALKNVSELNPSTTQYIIDWIVFAVASLLPLGLALVALLVAPAWTKPRLAGVGRWVERHARTIAVVVMFALAISLLR